MTERNIPNNKLANSSDTAEDKEKAIKEQKEIISRMQEEAGESRPNSDLEARDSPSINPEKREPIDPRMPNMPPA